jgi:hypothetical protein
MAVASGGGPPIATPCQDFTEGKQASSSMQHILRGCTVQLKQLFLDFAKQDAHINSVTTVMPGLLDPDVQAIMNSKPQIGQMILNRQQTTHAQPINLADKDETLLNALGASQEEMSLLCSPSNPSNERLSLAHAI